MNPLTLVKRTQKINATEAALGISEDASWHAKYKDSAYVYVGGIPYDLTEGDLLAVFAQYGEVVDVNLVRDKGTGKSKGFAFLAYEDQRSTVLAVDNLNGAKVLGRIVRVDHVVNYKKKEEEDEEEARKKREARGVCRAFQRGECQRGDACKFSHDEQRAANTGWGSKDDSSKWGHDKYPSRSQRKNAFDSSNHSHDKFKEDDSKSKIDNHHSRSSRSEAREDYGSNPSKREQYSHRHTEKQDGLDRQDDKRRRHDRETSPHYRRRDRDGERRDRR